MRTCPGPCWENGSQRQKEEKKKEKDREGNKMKEKSQRGEHRVIKGQTGRGKGGEGDRETARENKTGAVDQPGGSAV